ncbi:MAG: recombinase family protein, partial [Planctomycetota bacterium]
AAAADVPPKAVAWARVSTDMQEERGLSMPEQLRELRAYAPQHGIEIVREFADHGKSGLSAEHRDAFNDMLENWVKKRDDFQYVLVLDVSRWGRFQDVDLSATYSAECTKHGKPVVYTSLGLPKKNDPLHSVFVGFERFRAAQYSRDLSEKVFKGSAKVSEQGYHSGGFPPYGMHRLLLDEARRPVQILKPREWKSIQNQRVTLAPGEAKEIGVVRRIFEAFVVGGRDESAIAAGLNQDGVPSPGGARWNLVRVRRVLQNESYAGTMVYNRTTKRLLSPSRANPREAWVRKPEAFEGILPRGMFERARAVFLERERRGSRDYFLERTREIYERHGVVTGGLIRADPKLPAYAWFRQRAHGIDSMFQEMFSDVRSEVSGVVRARLSETARTVEDCEDFIVLNGRFTVRVQPAVPIPWGYGCCWSFRPDRRSVVDITLGVPLSGVEDRRILGYLALPRLLVREPEIRMFGSRDRRIELFGHDGLGLIEELLK